MKRYLRNKNLSTCESNKKSNGTKPKLQKRKFTKLKKAQEDINFLYCHWENECLAKFTSNKKYHDHIETHLNNYQVNSNKYNCRWKCCNNFMTDCKDEFSRHCFYHVYLEILYRVGNVTKQNLNLPECTNECDKKFIIPDLKNDFICDWVDCTYNFKSIMAFHHHVREHCEFEFKFNERGPKNKISIQCGWSTCKLEFKNLYRLKEHTMKHTNEKALSCPDCGQHLRTRTVFKDHIKRQLVNNTEEFQCEECFKCFANERLFRMHFSHHVNSLKCYLCDMTCSSSNALTLHIRCRHLAEKPYKCNQCDYRSAIKADIKKHVEYIHENIIYSCPKLGCSYSTKSKYKLQKHYSQIHESMPIRCYACHCCDKVYKSGNILSQHLIKVHSFQLPSGHKRFKYTIDENGMFRLQLTRIESLEVQQMLSPAVNSVKNNITLEYVKSDHDANSLHYEIDKNACDLKYGVSIVVTRNEQDNEDESAQKMLPEINSLEDD